MLLILIALFATIKRVVVKTNNIEITRFFGLQTKILNMSDIKKCTLDMGGFRTVRCMLYVETKSKVKYSIEMNSNDTKNIGQFFSTLLSNGVSVDANSKNIYPTKRFIEDALKE